MDNWAIKTRDARGITAVQMKYRVFQEE